MAQKILRLAPWEEACGVLQHVIDDEPLTFLDFGKFRVQLSSTEIASIREQLKKMIGRRISILKTDIHDEPILMRIVEDEQMIAGQ